MQSTDFDLRPDADPDHPAFWLARFESAFAVPQLVDFAAGSVGATRFVDCGADSSPDRMLSCAWRSDGVAVESVVGFSQSEADGRTLQRWQTVLPFGMLPKPFRKWRRAAAISTAPDCTGEMVLDGPFFYHSVFAGGEVAVVNWSSPDAVLHRPQCDLIRAYRWLRLAAGFRSWFPVRRSLEAGRVWRA